MSWAVPALAILTSLLVLLTTDALAVRTSRNEFSWFPIVEVAKLFAGLFITIIPAIAILRTGTTGALGPIVVAVNRGGQPDNAVWFWATGIL